LACKRLHPHGWQNQKYPQRGGGGTGYYLAVTGFWPFQFHEKHARVKPITLWSCCSTCYSCSLKIFVLMKIKENIKTLKKISMAYILQIFAAIVLFFFVGSSSANKTKEPATNIGPPLVIKKTDFLSSDKDSPLTCKKAFWGGLLIAKAVVKN